MPVPDAQLPVVLPEDCVPDGTGNPLNERADFLRGRLPQVRQAGRRETDTMDTFVDSSWYYMRYACPDNQRAMVDERVDYWLPVDQYIGGIEHAILHLLYSRFWTQVMRDLGLVRIDEPFTRLLTQGMVLNDIFQRKTEKGGIAYFTPEEVEVETDADGRVTGARARADGHPVEYGGLGTMSKSKHNGVDPQDLIEQYGADTARFFMIFTSPPEQTLAWSDSGVEGSFRFLKKLWAFAYAYAQSVRPRLPAARTLAAGAKLDGALAAARREVHLNLKQANFDMQRQQFNTVASACMKILNALEDIAAGARRTRTREVLEEGLSILLRVQAPITPHICFHLWRELGFGADMFAAPWPEADAGALEQDEIELVLQINGKTRGSIKVPSSADTAADRAAGGRQPARAEVHCRADREEGHRGARSAGQHRGLRCFDSEQCAVEPHRIRTCPPADFCRSGPGARLDPGCAARARAERRLRLQAGRPTRAAVPDPVRGCARLLVVRRRVQALRGERRQDAAHRAAPKEAQAVLEILSETREKQILSLTSAGRVAEYLLRYRVTFRLRDKRRIAIGLLPARSRCSAT